MKRFSDVLEIILRIAITSLVAIFIVPLSTAFLLIVPTSLMLLEDKDRN